MNRAYKAAAAALATGVVAVFVSCTVPEPNPMSSATPTSANCEGLIDQAHIRLEINAERANNHALVASLSEAKVRGSASEVTVLQGMLNQSNEWLTRAELCARDMGQ